MSRRDRLREKIMARCVRDEDGCLLWTGPTSGKPEKGKTGRDYPRMSVDGGTMAVHIVWWVIENGPIPPRKQLDHLCRKRRCVSCTEMVTHRVNTRRRDAAKLVCVEVAS